MSVTTAYTACLQVIKKTK